VPGLIHGHLPDPTGGQASEGNQYLGCGVLLLCLVGLVQALRGRPTSLGRHLGLIAVLGALTLLALSNHVYAGSYLLLKIKTVPAALLQFRATGRFFWPVAYVLVIAGVAMAARSLRPRAAILVLLAAAGLQIADTVPYWSWIWHSSRAAPNWQVDPAQLRPILARHELLTIWPSYDCGATTALEDSRFMQVLLLASETLMRTNTMYVARNKAAPDCHAANTLGVPWRPHEVRIIVPPAGAGERWLVPDNGRVCRADGALTLCAPDDLDILGMPPVEESVVPLGVSVPITSTLGRAVLGEGWFMPESDGAWIDGARGVLRFRVATGSPAAATITLKTLAIAAGKSEHQTVSLRVNGTEAAVWTIPDLTKATLQAVIPVHDSMVLELQVQQSVRPVDRGVSKDPRLLGLYLESLRMDPA
jgi:hypothetical protein